MKSKTDLSIFLSGLKGQHILYCPNPGNAGDGIIAHASYQLLNRLGLSFEQIDVDVSTDYTKGKVVIYGGGGNLVEPYPNARNFVEKHHQGAKNLIVLPHTILSYPELLDSLGSNVVLFCRERESFEFVSKHHGAASFYLSDDVALSMDVPLTFESGRKRFLPFISSKDMISRNAKRIVRRLHHALKNVSHGKKLYAFRDDVEKTSIEIPYSNIDISQAFSGDGMTEYQAHEVTYRVLSFINGFDVVYTNRLHVCISALLLGKEVHFYDNSYGKNKFVYENSFKDRFPRIVWKADAKELI